MMTPIEVSTSVQRCFASAFRVSERCLVPARNSTRATTPLTAEAATETRRPTPTFSSGTGCTKRCAAVIMMAPAANRIMMPSAAAEKYSALVRP